jgi:hypothetical protein
MAIGKKLMLCFAGMLALTLVLSYTALSAAISPGKGLRSAVAATVGITGCAEFKRNLADMVSLERGFALRTIVKDFARAEKSLRDYETKEAAAQKNLKDVRGFVISEAGRRTVDGAEAGMSAWQGAHHELLEAFKSGKDANSLVSLIADKIIPISDQVSKAAEDLIAQQQALLEASEKDVEENSVFTRWITLVFAGLSMLAGAAVLFVVRRSTQELLRLTTEMSDSAGHVANAAAQVSASS